MDRFKFRAWHDIAQEMLYEDNFGDCFRWLNEGQPLTLMQCTGQKDSECENLFAGDLVEDEYGKVYLVDFRYSAWCLIHEPEIGSEREGECKWDYLNDFCGSITIIGTIHDDA